MRQKPRALYSKDEFYVAYVLKAGDPTLQYPGLSKKSPQTILFIPFQ
jgi:hypothetical protein